jgi:hypothetical protein
MPIKNYVYGAMEPTAGLDVILEQFRLMHAFRNKLVEVERDRRVKADAVVRRVCPELEAMEGEAKGLSERAKLLEDGVREVNRLASASAGRPRVAATKAERDAARVAKKAAAEAWAKFKEAKASAYANGGVRLQLGAVEAEDAAARKLVRQECGGGLHWMNTDEVVAGTKDFRKGCPPEFKGWHTADRHRVACRFKSKSWPGGLPEELLWFPNLAAWAEPGNPPKKRQADSRRSALRRHLLLHMRVQSDDRGKPVWATVPFVSHRPFPSGSRLKEVKLLCRRVGFVRRWEVMFTVDVPAGGGDHSHAGAVGVSFKARQCEDGVEVAQWAGDDGRSGRVVIPADQIDWFDEGSRLRSAIDVTRELLLNLLGDWLSGFDRVTADRPFENPERQGSAAGRILHGFRGTLGEPLLARLRGKEDADTPTPGRAVATLRQWRSPGRLVGLHRWWADNRWPGDEQGFLLLGEWVKRYRHLEDWRANAAEQTAGWRKWFFRQVAADLRRHYRTAVLPRLGAGDRIERRPVLKAEGDAWVPPPDNPLKRVAATGLLRTLLKEAFADPREVPAMPDADPADVLSQATVAEAAVAEREHKWAKRHKKDGV